MFEFHIWITLILPVEETKIITGLVAKGYDVAIASANNELVLAPDNANYGILACKVKRELANGKEVYDDISLILSNVKINYYSLVISEFSYECVWSAGIVSSNRNTNTNKSVKVNLN